MRNIIAVIPARGGSKRLKRKNIHPFFGKPLIAWSIEACRRSRHIEEIFVSSEDEEIIGIAKDFGAQVIPRPAQLADDAIPKIEAIRHADHWLQENAGLNPEVLVSVQANSPEIQASDIDRGIELMKTHELWEVFSIDRNHVMNGAFRVLQKHCLYNSFLSAHMGVVLAEYIDVHTIEDLESIKARYANRNAFVSSRH